METPLVRVEFEGVVANISNEQIAKQIKRIIFSLRNRKRNPKAFQRWTRQEEEGLTLMVRNGLPLKEIAKRLDRSVNSVNMKRIQLLPEPQGEPATQQQEVFDF